jgi:hypothetical protein
LLADKNSVDMKLGTTVSEFGNLNFSKNGKRLFFGTAPIQPPKDTSIIEMDKAKLDIWHYNDDYLQTVQLQPMRLRTAQQENFLAVYDLEKKTIKQLGSKELPQVLQTNEGDGDTFVGITDIGKRVESQWRGNTLKDIYAIDVNTGEKKLVKENLYGQVYPSSTGKYIMWYDRKAKNYFVYDARPDGEAGRGNATKNITEKIKVPLYNEENDLPDEPNNYGVMGWHEGDSAVYVYDRYDVWRINLIGSKQNDNLTKGMGRYYKNVLRAFVRDSEKKFFNSSESIFLRKFNEKTKESGLAFTATQEFYYDLAFKDSNFLINTSISEKEVAENTEIIYTREGFGKSPDLYFALYGFPSHGLEDPTIPPYFVIHEIKLSSINPQQKDYNWGTAELFKWKAYNGKEATGLVYKPEDFDPKEKIPDDCLFL